MYFIVFLVGPRVYAVIPCNWIYCARGEIWEKFINNGLNSSQSYVCYWASENESIEYLAAPNDDFEPNFAAIRADTFPCNEGTYICRITKFKCTIA